MASLAALTLEVEGIGAATEQLLRAADVHSLGDLLRVRTDDLHSVVASLASREECEGWRRMAFLMQVEDLDGQLAETFWRGGVGTLEDLAQRTLPELRDLCQSARNAGTLPALPSDATLATILRDAAVLQHTGALTGSVRDPAGDPIAGTDVRVGQAHTTTDARGRFRLTALPLGRALSLSIAAAGWRTLELEDPELEVDPQTVVVRLWQLQPVDPSQPASGELSAHAGDALPRMAGQWMTSQRLQHGDLREGDLLVLRRIFANGSDAELVSKLPSYRDGKFVFFTWRVALNELPAGADQGAAYRVRNGTFQATTFTPRGLRALTANLRWRREQGLDSVDPATLDVEALVTSMLQVLDEEGLLHS